ncbi:acetyltransferase [Phormidium sp. CLA17]|uniref:acetyltransferase n=1 Tax=Leptolyngbya sp. Cla-17 TaxID=2803751 RepID=UPI00149104E6|nr:acetyltransferase [Leptolyngbya sp. Cla-17]MBM0743382.1 acetyltransferase [Leptolyngbya sp. Cla-17]
MFLKSKKDGALIKVLDAEAVINPMKPTISGRIQDGQEEQDPEEFDKANLTFPSDENLPQCWTDPDYQSSL